MIFTVRRKREARKYLQDRVGVKLGHTGPRCSIPGTHTGTHPCLAPTGTGTPAPSAAPGRVSPLAVGVEAPPGPEEGGGVQSPVGTALHGPAAAAGPGPRPQPRSAPLPLPRPRRRARLSGRRPRPGGGPAGVAGRSLPLPGAHPIFVPPGSHRGVFGHGLWQHGAQPSRWAGAARPPASGEPCAACKQPLKFQTYPNEGRRAGRKYEVSEKWWNLDGGRMSFLNLVTLLRGL